MGLCADLRMIFQVNARLHGRAFVFYSCINKATPAEWKSFFQHGGNMKSA